MTFVWEENGFVGVLPMFVFLVCDVGDFAISVVVRIVGFCCLLKRVMMILWCSVKFCREVGRF